MAPEIHKSSKYDEKVDLWSLGVIVYQLFSRGKFPFDGQDESDIYEKTRKGKFSFDGLIQMSSEAKDFLHKML